MKAPLTPTDEPTRVDTLRALNILDTAPEERFDRLTRLAKRLFGVPIALVSLIDTNRQWFKSRQGLDVPETPRDQSFCGHAILEDDILLIPDAALDERFSDNPLVLGEPHIRFYAGCPLRVSNGSKLGTLCLIDKNEREFGEEDKALLRDLARMAEQEIAAIQLATMDELTMVSNRRGFEALAQHAIGLCTRLELPATLLFFDLDGFKQINDTFGHAEGDRALVSFARLLLDVFHESDVVGRLGGDEFVVMVTSMETGMLAATRQRLQAAVDAYNQATQRGYTLAFSVGSVELDPNRHKTIQDLLSVADKEMYEHKRSKRSTAVPQS
ncbi:GGDEF domain-containing protein [Pigmentiphaga litoralis]|uniref:sensor domain-containing diguanylate cyclase n=1 Tax=Pigmentiphaga litoralis TaxID=516702 RepID=UPI0016740950|nr:sensor domain-containing diguanylate cyclase [Pigmentiphaga litoralis]GGX12491.1 GGDEF domain-containing protein [Pigmentiphaga litoralis]